MACMHLVLLILYEVFPAPGCRAQCACVVSLLWPPACPSNAPVLVAPKLFMLRRSASCFLRAQSHRLQLVGISKYVARSRITC